MADKKFLLENNLLEAYNNFMHLCNEHTYFSGSLDEEGEDQQDPNAQQQDPNAMGGDMTDPNAMGGEAPQDGGMGGDMADPNAMGGDMPQDGGMDPNAMGGDMADPNAMGGDMPQDGGIDPMMNGEMPMEDEMEEDEEVIDVDDITNAQEKTNVKVNKVGRNLGKVDDKLVKIMDIINQLQTMIDNNNAKIEAFKSEFERRNPTPTEKLNLRSLDSYPFNENPKNFWQGKATQPEVSGKRYDAYANNEEPVAKKEYVITKDDVDDYTQNSIRDSFHIDDDLRSTIEKIFEI